MTEVKLRHLLFFIFLFILTWFWNWLALVFFALIIISIVGTMYGVDSNNIYKNATTIPPTQENVTSILTKQCAQANVTNMSDLKRI